MRSFVALITFVTLAGCASREDTNTSIVTVNDGNGASQWEVRETPPLGDPNPASEGPKVQDANACSMQDGAKLAIASISGIGTEPFWNVRTVGRCVTYSTPEDQAGTRVWAKVAAGSASTEWKGALRGKAFVLTVKPKAGCSDGMSDKSYSMEATLEADGEVRTGCAEQRPN